MNSNALMTHDEADKRVCPFTFAAMHRTEVRGNCVGPNCMAWTVPSSTSIGKMANMVGLKESKGYCALIHKDSE